VGLSEEERYRKGPSLPLPVEEKLLADKPEHRIERPASQIVPNDNPWGFRLEVPAYLYDQGEVHNLSVRRGTITPEERYKIKEHIIQTTLMLEKLPFPDTIKRVPEIAVNHHESVDGQGYPRRLTGMQMSVEAKIMAIADIFEALTAADRPYKKGKMLSETLDIMRRMSETGHIDRDLFNLFVRSEVYLRYAREFMKPEQIDHVKS
jgi:HD-GYP domain-containing protein (c-di-GMP phosphodiesterase class II)